MSSSASHAVRHAEQIARVAHAKQFRRDGVTPYITHPAAVVQKLAQETDEVKSVAWLHDVLEDTQYTADDLRRSGVDEKVVDAVVRLTHIKDQSYWSYLKGVRENELSRKVKVADMLHNLSDSPTRNQIKKYARGLLVLLAKSK